MKKFTILDLFAAFIVGMLLMYLVFTVGEDCPWTHKSVPESEAQGWYDKGWEPFDAMLWVDKNGASIKIWLKKRQCRKGE